MYGYKINLNLYNKMHKHLELIIKYIRIHVSYVSSIRHILDAVTPEILKNTLHNIRI